MDAIVPGQADAAAMPLADVVRARREAEMIFTAAEIDAAIATMALKIAHRLEAADPIIIPIMLGGLFTAIRLSAHFDFPHEWDRLQVRRYGHDLDGGALQWLAEPVLDLRGRVVLVVDDILDKGVTLAAVNERLSAAGASQVFSAVLVSKRTSRVTDPAADFSALSCDDRFVFGCGMDYRGHWRGLPALYALAGS